MKEKEGEMKEKKVRKGWEKNTPSGNKFPVTALYADLPKICEIIKAQRLRFAGHCWKHEEPATLTYYSFNEPKSGYVQNRVKPHHRRTRLR